MNYISAAAPFMQVVDVLGQQCELRVDRLQRGQRRVPRIGGCLLYPSQPLHIPAPYKPRILCKSALGCQLLGVKVRPQTCMRIAKCGDAGFLADSRTGEAGHARVGGKKIGDSGEGAHQEETKRLPCFYAPKRFRRPAWASAWGMIVVA